MSEGFLRVQYSTYSPVAKTYTAAIMIETFKMLIFDMFTIKFGGRWQLFKYLWYPNWLEATCDFLFLGLS